MLLISAVVGGLIVYGCDLVFRPDHQQLGTRQSTTQIHRKSFTCVFKYLLGLLASVPQINVNSSDVSGPA